MKTDSNSDWDSRWRHQLERARRATPPAVDVRPSVLAALRARPSVTESWIQEFAALFGRGRALFACAAAATACAAVAVWQGYVALDSIEPFTRWLLFSTLTGGLS